MSDLNAACKFYLSPTARAGIGLTDHAQIGIVSNPKVAPRFHVADVIIFPVGPHDAIVHSD